MSLKLRRGTEAQRGTIVPAEGELIYTTDTKKLYIGDAITTGGNLLDLELKGNIAGNVNLLTHSILGTNLEIDGANGNIYAATVSADLKGSVFADDSTVLIDGINGRILGEVYTSVANIKITGGTSGQYLRTDGTGNLSWHTVSGGTGGGASVLEDLNDVNILSPRANQILSWNGANWINTSHFVGDVSGSVFGDDSTVLVDGVKHELHGNTVYTSSIQSESDIELVSTTEFGGPYGYTVSVGRPLLPNSLNVFSNNNKVVTAYGYTNGNSITHPYIELRSSRSSVQTPGVIQTSDQLFSIRASAYDSSDYADTSGIIFSAGHTATTGLVSGKISLYNKDNDGSLIYCTFDDYGDLTVNHGIRSTALSAAPTTPVACTTYIANGINWDPASKSGSVPYPVFYDGVAYHSFY